MKTNVRTMNGRVVSQRCFRTLKVGDRVYFPGLKDEPTVTSNPVQCGRGYMYVETTSFPINRHGSDLLWVVVGPKLHLYPT